jgi:predicted Zn finger-like uncharacterized protein
MIVTCQNCDTRFSLNDDLVKKAGSKVRCSKCKHVFMIYPDEPQELEMLSTDAGSKSTPVPREPRAGAVVRQPSLGDTLDGEAIAGGDLDLSEIEKMLATDGQGEADDWASPGEPEINVAKEKSPAVKPSAASAGALDLSEIEKMFEIEADLDDVEKTFESEPEDLVFDLEESSIPKKTPQKELDDFDVADIEKMLEEEMVESETDETGGLLFKPNEPPSPAFSGDEKVEDAEDPFAFSDIDEMMETDAAVRADSDTGDEEDGLTLEMDDNFKPEEPSSSQELAAAIEEIDFSDLEGMMKADTQPAQDAVPGAVEEELTLALDSDDRFETKSALTKWPESSKEPDLSRLDELLEDKEPVSSDEVSLELDIADIAPTSSAAADADDFDMQFDQSDTEDQAAADTTVEADSGQPKETEDLDLEFNDEELDEALAATEESAEDAASPAEEEEEETEADASVASAIQPAEAKRSRKSLVIVLVLVLLAGAAVGGHLLFGDKIIELLNRADIPLLSNLKKSAIPDAGNLKITTIDIDSRFVENSTAGRLFVISGKARNGYGDSRSLIRVTGKLYAKGKQLVNTETVYCGNLITGPELSTLTLDDIKNRLGNRQGNNDTNVTIKPGEDRPFMVVFSKLPENLEEFTIEVAGSESAAQSRQK